MNKEHKRLIERLDDSAKQVANLVAELTPEQLTRVPKEGEWSLHTALAHLRDTDVQVFLYRTALILNQDDAPTVKPFDQNEWNKEHYAPDEPIDKIMSEFLAARRKLIKLLNKTKKKDWKRYAIHPDLGKIPIEFIALHTYNHTLDHLTQVLDAHEINVLNTANGR